MSLFDTVVIDGIKYQTKAFGKGHRALHPGDEVSLEAVARTRPFDRVPPAYTVAIRVDATGDPDRLTVRDGRIAGLTRSTEEHSLPAFDYWGYSQPPA